MNSKIMIFGLICAFSVLVFLAGCTVPGTDGTLNDGTEENGNSEPTPKLNLSENPTEAYEELSVKSQNVGPWTGEYTLAMGLGDQAVLGLSEIKMDMEIFFSSKDRLKVVGTTSLMGISGTNASYSMNGRIIECSESSMTGDKVSCVLGEEGYSATNQFEAQKLSEVLSDYTIEFGEVKTFAGRTAQCFLLEYSGKDLIDAESSPTGAQADIENMTFKQESCLDIENGFVSFMDLKTSTFSELTEFNVTGISMTLELKSFTEGVDEKEFELPMAFSLGNAFGDTECEANKATITITPFKKISGETALVSFSTYTYGQDDKSLVETVEVPISGLSEFTESTVEIETVKELEENISIDVCIGEDCSATDCYVYAPASYETPFPEGDELDLETLCSAITSAGQEVCDAADLNEDSEPDCSWNKEEEKCEIAG